MTLFNNSGTLVWPNWLSPQAITVPSALRAMLCILPAAIAEISFNTLFAIFTDPFDAPGDSVG